MTKNTYRKPGIRKMLIALCMVLNIIMTAVTPVLAEEETETGEWYRVDVTNNVSIDDINIHLAEYEVDKNGDLRPFTQGQIVVPGQTVSKIVRVYNIARIAWIRIKPEFVYEDGMEGVNDSMFVFADDHWIKRGEYYYYTEPVETGDYIDFIKEVTVPKEWDYKYADKHFELVFTADAVQYENFTPNFNDKDPWFGTLIEQCIHSHYEAPETLDDEFIFGVEFRGGAEGLVRLGDDWFDTWKKLMPGDVVSNTATVKNNYKKPVEIFFYTENIVEGKDELLERLRLTIKDGDKVLFDDTLDKELKRISLGTFEQGEGTTITYTLTVPPELTNRFALTATKTKWIFECRLIDDNVKTGDTTEIDPWLMAAGISALLLIIALFLLIILKRKRRKDDEK